MSFLKKYCKSLIAIFIITLLIIILIKHRHFFNHMHIKQIKNYILSFGPYAVIIFVLIYSFKPLLIIVPASIMSILAGKIFGPVYGSVLNMLCCFSAATLAFYVSRYLGRAFVDKFLKGKALKLDDNIEKHGFKIMLIMRLSLVFPYDPLSYAAGLSKMKYKDFILATLLGVFPEMVAYSFMGNNLEHPFSLKFIFPLLGVIALGAIALYLHKKKEKPV